MKTVNGKEYYTTKEACKLINVGYEYITEMDGIKIFRKRK